MNGRTRRTSSNKWTLGTTKATKRKATRAERRTQKLSCDVYSTAHVPSDPGYALEVKHRIGPDVEVLW